MRTINVYDFAELSAEARNRVRNWYLKGLDLEAFEENWADTLGVKFPESDIAVSFSKVDGRANIYGTITRLDLVELVRENLTPDEADELRRLFSKYFFEWVMFDTHHACDAYNYVEDITSARHLATLNKFNRLVHEAMSSLCREVEADGYVFFHEVADSDLESWCEANGYEFLENGELYGDYE